MQSDFAETSWSEHSMGSHRSGAGKQLSYFYTVTVNLTEEQKQSAKESVTRKALETPELQATLDAGVTIWYKYFDASGKPVFEFSVKKSSLLVLRFCLGTSIFLNAV